MAGSKRIKSALISVFYKDNLAPVVEKLTALGVTMYSTGGTQTFIEHNRGKVVPVEELTDYPSILGGRVKTLHPKVFGGILGRRELQSDVAQLEEYEIPEIDLVIVDLYPFEETLASGSPEAEIIEKIDIGGVSLIRAAAKNHADVLIVSSRSQYSRLLEILENQKGATELEQRKLFAAEAFAQTSHYDTAIYNYFNPAGSNGLKISFSDSQILRYGENPHQKGIFHGDLSALFDKISGKELSYNNLLDVDAAVNLIAEFSAPTFAILKHSTACGVASRETLHQAWVDALAGDPVSAFGGILICNRSLDKATAQEIHKLFFEVLIAPSFEKEAVELLTQKQNRMLLVQKPLALPSKTYRSILNGMLEQDKDLSMELSAKMNVVTKKQPAPAELSDLEFALKLAKHTKSNTIVLAKNNQLLGSGVGQTSRVDALRQAIHKAKSFGFSLEGAVMASDAFFPFPDCVEIAHEAGITAVVQPGGSIKDGESVSFCDAHNMAMVTTGVRHFKH
jgi:phosphoribosylaminoimidazolecarboxamide formyltransferase/IMP cyclohydrolase